jgi:hypothetical protein
MLVLLFKLLIGHALADYPLQGDFIGKFKCRNVPSPIPGAVIWWHLLTAHALIHAGAVWIITGSVAFALVELVLHWMIDLAKCDNWTNFHADQALHVACKIIYSVIA